MYKCETRYELIWRCSGEHSSKAGLIELRIGCEHIGRFVKIEPNEIRNEEFSVGLNTGRGSDREPKHGAEAESDRVIRPVVTALRGQNFQSARLQTTF